jgi:mycofactocin precursor
MKERVMNPRVDEAENLDVVATQDDSPITAQTLIEEVSIDGMCGVY